MRARSHHDHASVSDPAEDGEVEGLPFPCASDLGVPRSVLWQHVGKPEEPQAVTSLSAIGSRCGSAKVPFFQASSSKQSNGLVPRCAQVRCRVAHRWGHTVCGGVGSIETCHLHIREGLVTAARDRSQAWGSQVTAKWGVSKGPQCVQAETVLHLLPEVTLQRQKHLGEPA